MKQLLAIIVLLALACPADAYSIVQKATQGGSLTATFGSTPTNGNVMVGVGFTIKSTGATAAVSCPTGWTSATSWSGATQAGNGNLCYKKVSGDGTGVTFTGGNGVCNSTADCLVNVMEVSGIATSPSPTAASQASCPASATPPAAGSFAVEVGVDGSALAITGAGASWTLDNNISGNLNLGQALLGHLTAATGGGSVTAGTTGTCTEGAIVIFASASGPQAFGIF